MRYFHHVLRKRTPDAVRYRYAVNFHPVVNACGGDKTRRR